MTPLLLPLIYHLFSFVPHFDISLVPVSPGPFRMYYTIPEPEIKDLTSRYLNMFG